MIYGYAWVSTDGKASRHRLRRLPPPEIVVADARSSVADATWLIGSSLWYRPAHDRNAADAVLRAAFDEAVAVGHIDQHVALTVEEADDLKSLED